MKVYKVFKHHTGKQEAVKQGWPWPDIDFGPLRALFKKLWGIGAGLLIAVILLSIFPTDPTSPLYLLSPLSLLVLYIVYGNNGNRLIENGVISRRYD